ncbi:MAG: beta-1,6-N-acetylglucosaminyltransferase, partial [Lachnospiraceae bacterium]|nr:beta-1,6-N-acetylglucosaminyltransferase [Lachnospiraceae bacterium]
NKGSVPEKFIERVKFYYPLQDCIKSRHSLIGQFSRKMIVYAQKILRVNRIKGGMMLGHGSAYFDITDEFARYVVSQEDYVRKHFKYTFCADEMFIQTMWLNWNKNGEHRRYCYSGEKHQSISDVFLDVNRAINFNRGTGGAPYTYKSDDYQMLTESGCLFARKFNYEEFPEIVDSLYNYILEV